MRNPFIRPIFSLLIVLAILLLAACSQPEASPVITPVNTVDTGQIAEAVLAEIEDQLATSQASQVQEPVGQPTADTEAIVAEVLGRLEAESAAEKQVPVAFASEAAAAIGQNLEAVFTSLYQRANPAVVYIIVPPIGSGSGLVFNDAGYIVTNNHVVEGGRNYEVVFAGGQRQAAELVGRDVDSDLAVLQVAELPDDLEPLPLGTSDALAVGQLVIAIGNPFGEQGSMSLGIISGLGRSLQSQRETDTGSSYSLPQVIQTDAPINPGNSGGPLLNLEGEVVGVNSAIATTTGINSGVGFAIPVDAVARIVPSLIENGAYDYPYLGAAFDDEISLSELEIYGLSQTAGAYVVSVTVGGPADRAGLIAASPNTGRGGDLIIALDGQPVNSFEDLNSYLVFHTAVGQTIEVTALRDGEQISLALTLGARP